MALVGGLSPTVYITKPCFTMHICCGRPWVGVVQERRTFNPKSVYPAQLITLRNPSCGNGVTNA